MPITITIPPIELDDEFARDVLTTARWGSIDYWAYIEHTYYQRDTDQVAQIKVTEHDDHNDAIAVHMITEQTVEQGIQRALSRPSPTHEALRGCIYASVIEAYAGHIGADEADVIVQLGLFNEVRYG